jgi:hypothetical protein
MNRVSCFGCAQLCRDIGRWAVLGAEKSGSGVPGRAKNQHRLLENQIGQFVPLFSEPPRARSP